MSAKNFPFETKPLDEKTEEEIRKHHKGHVPFSIRILPKGFIFPAAYLEQAGAVYNMQLRPDDIFVVTFPRSGTTWTQELVWLVNNNLDYETAKKIPLTDRYPFLEESMFADDVTKEEIRNAPMDQKSKDMFLIPAVHKLPALPSPRFIKTHLPFSLLPPSLVDTAKVVYVARDPRDVVISFYHFTKANKIIEFQGDFDTYLDWFIRDLVFWTPFFEHIKEAWQLKNHPNMLFLFYEELYLDLVGTCRRVAEFFGQQYSQQQLEQLAQHLHFDSFSKNKAVDLENFKKAGMFGSDMKFVRKGKSGVWREQMTAAQAQRMTQWMEQNLQGTGIQFPEV